MINRRLYTKILLTLISEALAYVLTDLFSQFILPIAYPTPIYIILGTLLAIIVVRTYDHIRQVHKGKVKEEIKEITDVALMRYHIQDKDN